MAEKVRLTDIKTMYILWSQISSDPDSGSIKTCFHYGDDNQETQLEKARKWANKRAKDLGTTVEESLSYTNHNK